MGWIRRTFLGVDDDTPAANHALASVSWDVQLLNYMTGEYNRELTSTVAAIYRARTMTVDAMASIPLRTMSGEMVPAPNTSQSVQEFLAETMRSLIDHGDAYWHVLPSGYVHVLNPSDMNVTWTDTTRTTRKYVYRAQRMFPGVNLRVLSIDRGPEDLTGFGPMQSPRIRGLIAETRYVQEYFENNGNPTGILEIPRTASKEEAEALQRQWLEARTIRAPAVLSGGMSWTQTAFSNQDSEWVAAHRESVGDAALLFGIPGAILGFNTPGSSLTYTSLGDLQEQWWRQTLQITYARRIQDNWSKVAGEEVRFDPEEFFLASLGTRSNSARQLVDGGWDPDDVLDVVGFPSMRYTGLVPTTLQPEGDTDD